MAINSVVIMGRLTADPELKSTQSGVEYLRATVAVDRKYTKQGEEKQTDFINITAWRQTAVFVNKYFSKGSMIAVQGSIQTGSYTDKDGNKRNTFEVLAENVSFCGGKNEGSTGSKAADTAAPAPNLNVGFDEIEDDDDLPF